MPQYHLLLGVNNCQSGGLVFAEAIAPMPGHFLATEEETVLCSLHPLDFAHAAGMI